MALLSFVILHLFSMNSSAQAALKNSYDITCAYKMVGAPFVSLSFTLHQDGSLSPYTSINFQGKVHDETLTPDIAAQDEMIHAWLSKESSDNVTELIVYSAPQAAGRSKLINPHIPLGNVIWGECEGLPY